MDKLYLLDAAGYIYRSYHAIQNMTNSKGESTNALYGFIRSVQRLFKDFDPKYCVAVWDGPKNIQKREAIYADYKAHRKEMPSDLVYQMEWAQNFCDLMGLPQLKIPFVEADDTLGSIAKWAEKQGAITYLCSSDKDLCQLVTDKVFILNTHKENLILDANGVQAQFGIPPNKMIDYLAITGDASDNVPGIPGFGPKTAVDLLLKFGSLDEILKNSGNVPGAKKQETLKAEGSKALMSRELVTIDTNVEIPHDLSFYTMKPSDKEALKELYVQMNFSSLLREITDTINTGTATEAPKEQEIVEYNLVDDEESLQHLVEYLSKHHEVCFDTETTNVRPMLADLVGVGLGINPNQAWYVPANGKLGLLRVLSLLKPLFENPNVHFYGHNVKYDSHILQNHGINVKNISFDTIIASYLLNTHSRKHSLDQLSLDYFGKVKIPIQDLIGKGKKEISMKDVPILQVCTYCCEDVDFTIRLKKRLEVELKERNFMSLFNDLEMPLTVVLRDMERQGIYLDAPVIKEYSVEIHKQLHVLEQELYQMAGEEFNLNSPKQLSYILFEKMGIKPVKKTATGLSTNVDVLESLKAFYPIAGKLLEYRTLEKLRSTYIDTLPDDINPKTQRIHPNFNQSGTTTGRLSCQDPNLQNIPVRTQEGLRIRESFRPEKEGWSYLAADYSQIELRLLAHLSEDPTLITAFCQNEDIHKFTASLVLGVPLNEVTKEQRHQAKTVNFGVIYGQGAYGLSQELGIEVREAGAFIDGYFKRYAKVKDFLENCKKKARESGKALTYSGRERSIPEINSSNGMIRSAAERLAINTPIQGTAADLIKMAMLKIHNRIKNEKLMGFMVLQIHDELIFEIPDSEIDAFKVLVKEEMEGVLNLKVPLLVDMSIGKNWKEC